jgi:phosphohistidine phosphatase
MDAFKKEFLQVPTELVNELYNGGSAGKRDSVGIHLSLVQKMRKELNTLMIVGHNDDLTEFAEYLTADGVPSLKKGSIAVLSVPDDTEWKDIKKGTLNFVYYLTPQFLRLEDLA